MIRMKQASTTIEDAIEENGYLNYIEIPTPSEEINELDLYIERTIKSNACISRNILKTHINNLVEKSVSRISSSQAKEDLTDFICTKARQYIGSSFTQSYTNIINNNYLSYEVIDNIESKSLSDSIDMHLTKLKAHQTNGSSFEDLVFNFAPSDQLSITIAYVVKERIRQTIGSCPKIVIGGQMKLHAPGIYDENSIRWHYDGDPRFIKVLCFLENQEHKDGSFYIRPNVICNEYTGSHVKTILQSISWDELTSRLELRKVIDYGIFLLNSHMPYLNKGYGLDANRDRFQSTEVVPKKLRMIIFKGVECQHKGGRNSRFYRPVYQGLIMPKVDKMSQRELEYF